MKRKHIFLLVLCCLLMTSSCKKFLDAKPQSALEIPRTLQDLEAILNNDTRLLRNVFPATGDIASDYFVLDESRWNSLSNFVREIYCWDENAQTERDWHGSYLRIFDANVVLEYLDQVDLKGASEIHRKQLKGKALFFRAWSYMQLLPIFTSAYDPNRAEDQLGLPLRLSADINEVLVRSNLLETYGQIKKDLLESLEFLPENTLLPIDPTKAAGLAALSRLCLWMGDYESALRYADQSLGHRNELMDYQSLNPLRANPFDLYNKEVLFHCTMRGTSNVFTKSNNYVDPALIAMYTFSGDLRSELYFDRLASGAYQFKGDYSGDVNFSIFMGLAVDEVYLIRAECLARLGRSQDAMVTMNMFLEKRWAKDQFVPFEIQGEDNVLRFILDERCKSLAYRKGIRWADLKRLNMEGRFIKVLHRQIDGQTHVLEPNDPRYTFLIPVEVIQESGIPQNMR